MRTLSKCSNFNVAGVSAHCYILLFNIYGKATYITIITVQRQNKFAGVLLYRIPVIINKNVFCSCQVNMTALVYIHGFKIRIIVRLGSFIVDIELSDAGGAK